MACTILLAIWLTNLSTSAFLERDLQCWCIAFMVKVLHPHGNWKQLCPLGRPGLESHERGWSTTALTNRRTWLNTIDKPWVKVYGCSKSLSVAREHDQLLRGRRQLNILEYGAHHNFLPATSEVALWPTRLWVTITLQMSWRVWALHASHYSVFAVLMQHAPFILIFQRAQSPYWLV